MEVKNPQDGKMERVLRYDYRELVPLLRHRHEPEHPEVRARARPAARCAHVDRRAAAGAGRRRSCASNCRQAGKDKGAAVVMDPATGDLLAAVSYPLPADTDAERPRRPPALSDRARYGLYPPGSTFKIVTAMAALRKDRAHWRTRTTSACGCRTAAWATS